MQMVSPYDADLASGGRTFREDGILTTHFIHRKEVVVLATENTKAKKDSKLDDRADWPQNYGVAMGVLVALCGIFALMGFPFLPIIVMMIATAGLWVLYLIGHKLEQRRTKNNDKNEIDDRALLWLHHTKAESAWIAAIFVGVAGFIGYIVGMVLGTVPFGALVWLTDKFGLIIPLIAVAFVASTAAGILMGVAYGVSYRMKIVGLVCFAISMMGVAQWANTSAANQMDVPAPEQIEPQIDQEVLDDACAQEGAEELYVECQN